MSQPPPPPPGAAAPIPAETAEFIRLIRERVGLVVVGQDVVVERLLIALFTGGHLLLQGVPGLAKTLLVATLGRTIALAFSRIQFSVDLLPSDILGSEILDQRTGDFRTHQGPIFTNLLLADEINRAAPKVQSALLEAMQERKVTIGNETFSLPAPFLVIATQNPVEQSGTFELPEAQLDRFMLCHRLEYPTPPEEKEVLRWNAALGVSRKDKGAVVRTEFDAIDGGPVGEVEQLVRAIRACRRTSSCSGSTSSGPTATTKARPWAGGSSTSRPASASASWRSSCPTSTTRGRWPPSSGWGSSTTWSSSSSATPPSGGSGGPASSGPARPRPGGTSSPAAGSTTSTTPTNSAAPGSTTS